MKHSYISSFLVCALLVSLAQGTATAEAYVGPDAGFLNSIVLARPGIEDLGDTTVAEFAKAVAESETKTGRSLQIQGWTRIRDGYALHVTGDHPFSIEFVWSGGGTSLLRPVTIGDQGIPSVLYVKTYVNL